MVIWECPICDTHHRFYAHRPNRIERCDDCNRDVFPRIVYDPAQGNWIPACGGTEVPFYSRTGRKLLYVWQPSSGNHAYLDCGTDMLLTSEEHLLYIAGKL